MQPRTRRKPEIMSPAGYWPQLHAAIEAGADSVYFGLKHFSARAKVGFDLSELPQALRTLHQRGVRGYITFNTLVFEHEITEAARTIAAIAESGADALIIQDLGIARLAHQIAPEIEVHASTQMSITSADGVALAQAHGVNRVTLARELSLDEIRAILAKTDCELEMFVHGALCVAYSGQCFSSEAWGGRSANRGQCAQACRLPYQLLVNGVVEPLADARYLLSPGDLYALHQVPEIVAMGVSALKIEGRYKDADYVALTTSAYRKAVDDAWNGLPLSISPAEELRLEQVYSRGLGPFFVSGTNHQTVVAGRAPRHRGLRMGRVVSLHSDCIVVDTASAHPAASTIAPLKAGDGVVFDAADWRSLEEPEEGGRVYQATPHLDGRVELRFANRAIRFPRIRPGDVVWRTSDPGLSLHARQFTQAASPVHRQPVCVHVVAREGQPLLSEWWLAAHPATRVTVASPQPLAVAQNRAIATDFLREQFGRLGDTPFRLESVALDSSGSPFAPASLLNQMRREAVDLLGKAQGSDRNTPVRDPLACVAQMLAEASWNSHLATPMLHLLVRTPEQLDAALEVRPASITLDYLDLYGLRPSVQRIHASGLTARVASPRILKPSETRILQFLLSLDCEILVRGSGMLVPLKENTSRPLTGDFSLNASNSLTAQTLLNSGLQRLTPAHDLNAAQVTDLARTAGADRIEVVAYQHLPVFHTEHCVFCRFLSTGTSYRDCGRPCEQHRVALRDDNGRAHPVIADVGCRNTVFGAEAQEASLHLDRWLAAGILHYRVEFVHESAEQTRNVAEAFASALAGRLPSAGLHRELQRIAPEGITEGSLFVPRDYLTFPILQ